MLSHGLLVVGSMGAMWSGGKSWRRGDEYNGKTLISPGQKGRTYALQFDAAILKIFGITVKGKFNEEFEQNDLTSNMCHIASTLFSFGFNKQTNRRMTMTDAINFVNSRALAAFRASTTTASGDDRALDFVRQLFRGWEWSSVGGCEDWHDQKATYHVFGYDDVDARTSVAARAWRRSKS